jgi:2-polyprenyl-3-methyl-5-hydroxy-6-metoxy-1,4-benzoquinol methylase
MLKRLEKTEIQTPDFSAIKQKQQATWASGNYAVVGTTLQIAGERLCEAVDIRSGEKVLDVAAGNGNATLAAARHFADVTSTDYVETLLQQGGHVPRLKAFLSPSRWPMPRHCPLLTPALMWRFPSSA